MKYLLSLLALLAVGSAQACAPVALVTPFASVYQVPTTYVSALQFVQYAPQVAAVLPTVSYAQPRLVAAPVDPVVDPAPLVPVVTQTVVSTPLVVAAVPVFGYQSVGFHSFGFNRGFAVRTGFGFSRGFGFNSVAVANPSVVVRSGLFGRNSVIVNGGAAAVSVNNGFRLRRNAVNVRVGGNRVNIRQGRTRIRVR